MRVSGRLLIVIAATLAATALAAQETGEYQYVVKFVCGRAGANTGVVAPGTYFTAINVHNPNERGFEFRKKFSIALPGEKAGRVSRFFDTKLGPDEAFEIDCPDILRHLDAEGFVKGFAVIESKQELDVVAVYTAAGSTRMIETMDVEHVKARRSGDGTGGGLPDLIPVPDAAGNFCRIRDGRLIVTVRNQGSGNAGPSTTRVDFSTGTSATEPTPGIPAGGSVDVLVPVPAGCFQPDCSFRIKVDSGNVITESDEANNTASGGCIG